MSNSFLFKTIFLFCSILPVNSSSLSAAYPIVTNGHGIQTFYDTDEIKVLFAPINNDTRNLRSHVTRVMLSELTGDDEDHPTEAKKQLTNLIRKIVQEETRKAVPIAATTPITPLIQ